jgi:ATP-dependent DNA helicase RecQ
MRQCILAGFVSKDIENYGLLKLTPAGHAFIEKPYSIMLTKDHDYESAGDDDDISVSSQKTSATDEVLFNMLKDLRKKIARQKNVPPFVIFQDPSLEDMAVQYPITLDELKNIIGVGQGKAVRFGKEFIEVIAQYVEEHEIDRPMDMVVKSVVNKSGLKVYIIQSIDRRLPFEDIAKSKGVKVKDVIAEIESIVSSGTRVNIDYYIEDNIDEDKQDEVYEYFKTAETDSVADALNELGEDDYTEDEIRLMRIKFISEMGN